MTTTSESRVSPELVMNLKDRLKHGQNVTKILESQLDTAQQNISLLQGQVRLANETILNLKKHFHETENILSQLLTPEQQAKLSLYESDIKDSELEMSRKNSSVDSTTRSPLPSEVGESNKSYEEKNKSPYAIQLRQVLDVLDEEPRKQMHSHDVTTNKDCACAECQTLQKRYDDCDCGSSSCSGEHYHRKNEESCRTKHKPNGHLHRQDSPKAYCRKEPHVVHSNSYSHNCTGPCCSNPESSYKMVEKSPPVHYVSVHSPGRSAHDKHSERHHGGPPHHHGHCNDKCGPYVNYVPYGYHVMEGVPPGMPESLQPLSPSSRRKRPFMPVMQVEEPPHLKYTKVKRIDGSKLTAQKVLQDFTKRRFLPYNPRFDLDLLIVPPPIPAVELMKKQINFFPQDSQRENLPRHHSNSVTNQPTKTNDNLQMDQSRMQQNDNNDVSSGVNNNNNNNNNSNIFNREAPYKNFKHLQPIKEEHDDNQSKLENHIDKLYHADNRLSPQSSSYQKTTFYDIPASPTGGSNLKPDQPMVTVGSGNRNF